jgi:hypothetical protein
MSATKQLAMNLSGYAQLPLLTEDQARDEFRRLADLNAVPPRTAPYRPYVAGSETSREAAERLDPEKISEQARRVLAYFRRRGAAGATDHELFAALPDVFRDSLRRARCGLRDDDWVKDSGARRVNPDSGKRCVVWIHKHFVGQEVAA